MHTLNFHTMKHPLILALLVLVITACNNSPKKTTEPSIREEGVVYTGDSVTMKGWVAYDENSKEQRPAILVVHEWNGLNDYAKRRTRELAELGYVAMAADVYGNGTTTTDPDTAMKLSLPFYKNPEMAKARIDAAIEKIKTFPQVDTTRIGAIGYCFGGGMLLNVVRLGSPLQALVSFHGSLVGTPADKNLLRSQILVCHGSADPFVTDAEVAQFKKQMDSIGAPFTFKEYANAKHGFTNPGNGTDTTAPVVYNAVADTASWKDMVVFLQQALGK